MPYDCADLKVLIYSVLTYSVLTTATKRAVGLTAAAPNALVQAAPERDGLGCHSLQVEVAVQAARTPFARVSALFSVSVRLIHAQMIFLVVPTRCIPVKGTDHDSYV